MAEYDNKAFNNMQEATAGASDEMFTESEYNINATNKERKDYDLKAYSFLQDLFQEDQAKRPDIKDWDFDRYLSNLKDSYLEEKFINSKKGDPAFYGKAGSMLRSVYSDDVGQLKLSARNAAQMLPSGRDDESFEVRAKRAKDRSNISIKAPEAEQY
jgi:hypothetical protein